MTCEPVGPLQGSKSPKSGKEGFGVKKLPFPNSPEKGALSQKNPHFSTGLHKENGDFSTQSALFWGDGTWEFFDPEPSFPDFGDFDPCRK